MNSENPLESSTKPLDEELNNIIPFSTSEQIDHGSIISSAFCGNDAALKKGDAEVSDDRLEPSCAKSYVQHETESCFLPQNLGQFSKSVSGRLQETELQSIKTEGLKSSKTFCTISSSPKNKQLSHYFSQETYPKSRDNLHMKEVTTTTNLNEFGAGSFQKSDLSYSKHNSNLQGQTDNGCTISKGQQYEEGNESQVSNINTQKHLVRTKTFSLSESPCSTRENENVENVVKLDKHPSNLDQKILLKSRESCSHEDPLKMREIERKKGSLIFEHNFQTFSNIPPTNMMSVSLGSDNSMRLISLYNKMKENSMQSSAGNEEPFPSPSFLSLYEKELYTNQRPQLLSVPHSSQEEVGQRDISNTQSPSPDSLCIDQPPLSAECNKNSVSKEDLNIEEKERDDKEISVMTKLNCASSMENIHDSHDESQTTSDLNSSDLNGAQLSNIDDCKPIVSGGSTLRQKDSFKIIKEESYPKPAQRQISSGSVKDFDDIPLVCSYISPEREEEQFDAKKKPQNDQSQQIQSMFSMFIDLDQIPSAEKDTPDPPKPKPHASGGMYMFIEADDLSSPKSKRKNKPDFKSSKCNKLPSHLEMKKTSKSDTTPLETTPMTLKAKEAEDKIDPQNQREVEKIPKKGFFTFIETENSSKENSPRPKRRPPLHRKNTKSPNVMSKSAPSDCLLFSREDSSKTSSSTESSSKLMTKSVIDREEFMAQPPTRCNVSLSDKINESSKIPRPIGSLKKLALEKPKNIPSSHIAIASKLSNLKKKSKDSHLPQHEELEVAVSDTSTAPMNATGLISSLTTDAEDTSDFSDISSLLSNIDRSNEFSSDQEGKESNNALGNDLLKMFLNEINTDVTVQIGERKIRAHKCILASRCAYFAAMLSGHWVESAGNIIKLQGFSPETVMVALRHIYSGSSTVPCDMDVKELAALADMLALDGLKDVVALHLKAEACHYFHKPCPDCIKGVLEVLPIASTFCLEDLYHKCLKWIAKYFATVMPTRVFSALPSELQDRCLKQIVDDMSVNNVIDTVLGGDHIISVLPVVRWAQPIFDLTAQLLESATNFIATNFSRVLASDRFQTLADDDSRCIDNLEDTLKVACDLIRPDQAVLSHIQLTKLSESISDDSGDELSEGFLGLISRLLRQVEKFIIHNANRVAVCRKWPLLPPETQKRIKDAALVVVEFSKPTISRQKFGTSTTVRRRGNSIEPVHRQRTSSLSDHRLSRSASASVVPPRTVAPPTTKRLQLMPGRCHTPPLPSGSRAPPLQTPPPTRASTLRAQARQAAIQRSQSARTVVERPKRNKPSANDVSTENDSSSNSGCTKGAFTRSRTSSQGSFSTFSGTSRSSTPGISDRTKHKRNASVPHLVAVNGSIYAENEILQKKPVGLQRPSEKSHEKSGSKLLFRAYTPEAQSKPLQLQSSSMSNLREFSPREQKKHPLVVKAAKSRPAMGRRLRSPLRENNRANAVVSHALPRVSSGSTKDRTEEAVKKVEPVGLGSRSNTFCKDDRPPPPPEVDND